jgi:hypothetical protein
MSWDGFKKFLWSHELFYAFLIVFTAAVVGLLVYIQFFT